MTTAWSRIWRPLLGIAILAIVIAGLDGPAIAALLVAADVRLVMLGVLGLTAMHLLAAAGWRAIVAVTSGVRLPWRTTLSVYYASQAIGGITPANIGGDAHRAAAVRHAADPWAGAIAPLLVQRATSYLALSSLSLLALGMLASRTDAAGVIVAIGVVFAVAVAAVAAVVLIPPRPLQAGQARLVRRVTRSSGSPVSVPRLGTAALIGFGQGLAFHAGSVVCTLLLVLAVDPSVPVVPVGAALAVARLGLAVPFVPSGLGVQEGVLAALFVAIGLAPETALAAMLLARLSLLLTTLVGSVFLVRPGISSAGSGVADDRALKV